MLRLFNSDSTKYELCIDEVGRGCLFGPTHVACVVFSKNKLLDTSNIKDSKKFSSKTKIRKVSESIKSTALYYHIAVVDNEIIDKINILQSVMQGMHECIQSVLEKIAKNDPSINLSKDVMALIDGNYFKPYTYFDSETDTIKQLPHICVEKGDATYVGIAAASILAKVARDDYILALCEKTPVLKDRYQLHTNMGYGTKAHLDGIRENGITNLHRTSFKGTQSDLPPLILEKFIC